MSEAASISARKGFTISIGIGKTTVEFCSAPISVSVCKYRNCIAAGLLERIVAASSPDEGASPATEAPKSKTRNATRDFHGEKRSNETHASTTDPDARLFKMARGQAARLCHMGHLLMENRHGLIVDTMLTHATGTAEREPALAMLERMDGRHRITLAADKTYDVSDFIAKLRALGVTPHVAQNTTNRRSAIDGRTTCHPGYAVSQRIRQRVEEGFGWMKFYGGMRKTRHVGNPKVAWTFTLTAAACNQVRLPKLMAATRQYPDSVQKCPNRAKRPENEARSPSRGSNARKSSEDGGLSQPFSAPC